MKQIFNLLPNHVYRIKSKISVIAIEIHIVRFETHKEYNSVMNGASYVKYTHRRKKYVAQVINNMFKSPDFKIRDKTVFFIEPDVEISKDIEKKEIEKTVKEGERKILNHYHEYIETNKKNGIGVMERKRTETRVKIGSKLITSRKRVAFFTIDGYFGGPAVHSYNIIKMFIKNGVEFDVFSFQNLFLKKRLKISRWLK